MEFSSNDFEHDYILQLLGSYRVELATDKPEAEVTDKYAVALTTFMAGQIAALQERPPCDHDMKHTGMYEPFDTACAKCGSFGTEVTFDAEISRPREAG